MILIIIIYSSWINLGNSIDKVNNIKSVKLKLEQMLIINNIISELQKERGLSLIYESNPKKIYKAALLKQQNIMEETIKQSSYKMDNSFNKSYYEIHRNMDKNLYKKLELFKAFTNLIETLISRSEELIFNTNNIKVKNQLILYHNLNRAQELMGQLRAKVGGLLALNKITKESRDDIFTKYILLNNYLDSAYANMNFTTHQSQNNLFKQPCLKKSINIIDNITKSSQITTKIEALEWFKLSTCAVSSIYNNIKDNLDQANKTIEKTKLEDENDLMLHQLFWFLSIIILSLLLIIYLKHSKALSREQKILSSYKNAISNSTIVSASNKKGRFTYINKSFSDITGYQPTELLSHSDAILLHPDMPKDFLKNLWHNLKINKEWSGIVQSITKDGKSFWVDTTISPIYNEKNQIIEYITIRHNITDMILLTKEIKETQREIIYRLGEAVESRSKESGYHIRRVAHYSKILAELVGLSSEECEIIFTASSMHDVGKIAIPDSILLKPDFLTDEERTLMKSHAEVGYNILKGSQRPILKAAAMIAYEHHEHYNGKGYPQGLKGEEISLYGRIVAIADVFDALVSDRVYKKAWSTNKVLDLLESESGEQFDPKLIKLFLENIELFLEVKDNYQDVYQDH